MVLRVGWYSNKAESNSIHWTEESVRQQRGAAELVLQARQRRQTARLERTRNSDKLIRLTLVSFLPSFLPQKNKSHFSLFLFFQGRSTHSPSSLSSSPSSARTHQLYITKSLCARDCLETAAASNHRKSSGCPSKVKVTNRKRFKV